MIQLQQVVFNLLTNGIQAMSEIDRKERNLMISTDCKKNEVTVCVSDSGKGINPEILDRMEQMLTTPPLVPDYDCVES